MTAHLAGTIIAGVIPPKWAGLLPGLVTLILAGAARGEAPQQAFTPPRVVAAIYSAGGPMDRVMLLFDSEVPRPDVVERINRLAEACGSKASGLTIEYHPFESLGQPPGSKPVMQTIVRFGIAGLADWKRGALAVAPFARAFHGDLPMRVVYNVSAEFPFHEPAGSEFLVDGARVRHFPNATSHLYDLTPAGGSAPPPSPASGAAVRRWSRLLVGLAIAIVLTVIVLIVLLVLGARQPAPREAGLAGQDVEESKGERSNPGRDEGQGESEERG